MATVAKFYVVFADHEHLMCTPFFARKTQMQELCLVQTIPA